MLFLSIIIKALVIFYILALIYALKWRPEHKAMGIESLLGARGVVVKRLTPEGLVRLEGETWRAESLNKASISKGKKVVVKEIRDMKLFVKEEENV